MDLGEIPIGFGMALAMNAFAMMTAQPPGYRRPGSASEGHRPGAAHRIFIENMLEAAQ